MRKSIGKHVVDWTMLITIIRDRCDRMIYAGKQLLVVVVRSVIRLATRANARQVDESTVRPERGRGVCYDCHPWSPYK